MASASRPVWQIAAALVIGLVVAGAPAAYFYSQNSTFQSQNSALKSQQTALNSQISSFQSNETSLRSQIAILQANVTALTAQRAKLSANATASAQQIQQLDNQITTLNVVITDLQGIAAHENLAVIQTLDDQPLSWSGSPGVTGALFFGPDKITNFAGYLNFTFTNPSPSNVQDQVNVTWDAYGYHYSDVQTVTGSGTITFPVLITNDLNFFVASYSPTSSGSVHMTILWYD